MVKLICLKDCTDGETLKLYKEGEVIELPPDRAKHAIEIGACAENKDKNVKGK